MTPEELSPWQIDRLLARLKELFRHRAELEQARLPELETRLKELQRRHEEQKQQHQQEYQQRQQELHRRHEQQLAGAQTRRDEQLQQAQAEHDRLVAEARGAYEQALQNLEEQFEQSKWEIAALLEAKTDRIQGEAVTSQSQLAQYDQVFQDAENLGQRYLERHRVQRPELPPVQYPPVSKEQLGPSLAQAAQAVEQVQGDFLRVARRGGLGVLGTLGLFLVLWGAGAAGLGHLMHYQGWLWIALSGVGAAGLALVAALVVRSIRTGQMLQYYEQMLTQARWGQHLLEQARGRLEKLQEAKLAYGESRYREKLSKLEQKRDQALAEIQQYRDQVFQKAAHSLETKTRQAQTQYEQEVQQAQQELEQGLAELKRQWEQTRQQEQRRQLEEIRTAKAQLLEAKDELVAVCQQIEQLLVVELSGLRRLVEELFPPWDSPQWDSWQGGVRQVRAVPLGRASVQLEHWPGALPQHRELSRRWPAEVELPVLFPLEEQGGLLLRHSGQGASAAVEVLRNLMLRLLTALPPGKVRFTILDPVGLGENFAAFMHLADYNEHLVGRRIWTERTHIEKQLADLTEHMEHVIQTYLRNQYETIQQYNAQAGEVAEPYRVLVVAGFPTNFSEAAMRRLLSILSAGPRCGVFVLLAADSQQKLPPGLRYRDLEEHCRVLRWREGRFVLQDEHWEPLQLQLDAPPPAQQFQQLVHRIGQAAQGAGRVEVPFDYLMPPEDQWWQSDSRRGLEAPLGRAGATKLQPFRLGQGTAQHVLVGGKTGSGKSNLLHVLALSLAMRYDPQELELYLIDFKKGVEFKPYATGQLPHARVVAIESEREFGLSVLQRLDQELRRRGDLFRSQGVQDLAAYRDATGRKMPRVLLVVDEFQEFFTRDDALAQQASLLLDRLVRQGRAFGIHILLGSQTLAGVFSLARGTLGQMGVRIALQCSEADAALILSEGNTAARLLSRPGEAIYNDAGGLVEGNQPFQVAWLPEDTRQQVLDRLHHLAQQHLPAEHRTAPIVFEGAAPAHLERNAELASLLQQRQWSPVPRELRAWLGDPVAIAPPLAVPFAPESGNHLLVVGYQQESALAMFTAALVGLAAQGAPAEEDATGLRFVVLDGTRPGDPGAGWFSALAARLPHPVEVGQGAEGRELLAQLAQEVTRRAEQEASGPRMFLLLYHLAHLRWLRRSEDDLGFGSFGEEKAQTPWHHLQTVLTQGAAVGVHVLLWCDAPHVLQRSVDRQLLREFDRRVLFQMGADDSSMLIDSPEAGSLGLYRALYFDQESGVLEKFRPYQVPEPQWLEEALGRLRKRELPARPPGKPHA